MLKKRGLYDPAYEHDACGVGFVARLDGERTHEIVEEGVQILCNLEHRGAVGGDMKTGDGAGMLLQIPHKFFSRVLPFSIPEESYYGAGMIFLPANPKQASIACAMTEMVIAAEGGTLLGWRDVPVNPDCLGEMARSVMPSFKQIFVSFDGFSGEKLETKLYTLRKCLENIALARGLDHDDYYLPSLSSKTIIYKGMFVAPQFVTFYPDLAEKDFISAMSLVHQRYSTNTFPSWPLAQPFRYIAHNGEINTLRRNTNNMKARETSLSSEEFGKDLKKMFPIVQPNGSDSAAFDNVFELISRGGRSMEHTMMMMVPEAFGAKYHISEDKRSFFEYHAAIMEPWDGPAALVFSDGYKIGATLDRNGLRPGRYTITKSGKVVLASEAGVIDIEPEDILENGRLEPGKMFLVDLKLHRVIRDNEIKSIISRQKPYRRWLSEQKIELKGLNETPRKIRHDSETLLERMKSFGYTFEDVLKVITPMASNSQEPIGSMGNDSPLAVLSERPQLIYDYFKQLFAQVTNPPIDPYREHLVMSLMSFVGRERNLLQETPEHCRQLKLTHPVLTNDDIKSLKSVDLDDYRVCTVPLLFEVTEEEGQLEEALDILCATVETQIDNGHALVILSDRGVDKNHAAIPALLAISAVHHFLVRQGKRHLAGLIIESGEVRSVHHFATLIGYGASGVNPYLVFEALSDLKERGYLQDELTLPQAIEHYVTAVKKGLLKVMSKMGVSTIRSYRGSQIYEAIGLSEAFVEKYFSGTASRVGGIDSAMVEHDVLSRHRKAWMENDVYSNRLASGGEFASRKNADRHLFSAEAVVNMQKAVRLKDYSIFKKYTQGVNDISKNLNTLRGLFKFKPGNPVPIDEVEPVSEILNRFVSSAMSFGSMSKEVHETMAIAMNGLGANSNSGEGGEDMERYHIRENGDNPRSNIKQIASGRFGVDSSYLANCNELQIKMAQGAKPGEGGQLPGYKVNEAVAKVRHSTPGVMLISPPPHHDIYSIEDLSQLIFDLKNANPKARVSVKLVSEVGVGTVAAGVAKGKADMVLISGGDGGTGASPLSSLKHAGSAWEIGLAETQQVLVMNKLRSRIRIQCDGQMKTGRDVVIAALLGAEEFGFGSASLVSLGCVMMRKCHTNACPVGIATQNEELRKRFTGKPEHLRNFMTFIAQEVREYMAELGFRNFDEMVGHVERLEVNEALDHYKNKGLDFSNILMVPDTSSGESLYCISSQDHDFSLSLDQGLIEKAKDALENRKPVVIQQAIKNCNRTVGATLSYEVTTRYGSEGLKDDTIHVNLKGSAGQSFGAFLTRGITFELEGESNDYLGKGLSGGRIILYPRKGSTFSGYKNIITGNVNLFGATGGEVFINGRAGERFAVRNSGALAVVEGVGDHGCEYMTGGRVIILGKTGVNFAAGMSGGVAYVYDENQLFDTRCNLEMVDIEPVVEAEDIGFLKTMISRHIEYTDSKQGKLLLESWEESLPNFVKVMPLDYRMALARIKERETKETDETAITEEVYV
ncbi:glutamate synthase large subunit [Oceanispirochaeta sp.]|jgi:glutamate synthase domain-containing protein 2/glutamate synthase domain-containing protein 1/glutamate synthase domain-containing protein 3|uniref:glutamate synthase large subunit n=1 Tax=Oceanispirochaeta sp. TaxID=2035350 RepID=UPI00260EDD95|nr:glutamate synthase large subunit [Oceanispirochaeta sp.]MDA3955605.1 glutamate synthase large subunit [Oceanispirochaeta sp.]